MCYELAQKNDPNSFTNKFIIGISGKKQSGKDTVASILLALFLNKDFDYDDDVLSITANVIYKSEFMKQGYIYRFGDSLKEVCSIVNRCDRNNFENNNFKNKFSNVGDFTNRELLISVGKYFTSIDKDIWIKCLCDKIKHSRDKFVIIPDVRFNNEKEFIKTNNGIIIRINSIFAEQSDDVSETELDDSEFDYIIENNSKRTIFNNNLLQSVKEIYDDIIKKIF